MSSPRSVISDLAGSPPRLDPSTMALLDSFMAEKAEAERKFAELSAAAAAAHALQEQGDLLLKEVGIPLVKAKPMITVSDFRGAFREDWQLSQFWYTDDFAEELAERLHTLCDESTKVAFLCCPTAFVAFQGHKPLDGARLLEVDNRFTVVSPTQFVHYDMTEPDVVPEDFTGHFDLAVVDPPFLNENTNRNIAQTLKKILKPAAKLIMITSTSVQDVLDKVYTEAPLGPLRKAALVVRHMELANDFACWGSWEGAETF